jgi:hypothetical protein
MIAHPRRDHKASATASLLDVIRSTPLLSLESLCHGRQWGGGEIGARGAWPKTCSLQLDCDALM